MSSTNALQGARFPLKEALEGRRRLCEEYGEMFESTPMSSTADHHYDEDNKSCPESPRQPHFSGVTDEDADQHCHDGVVANGDLSNLTRNGSSFAMVQDSNLETVSCGGAFVEQDISSSSCDLLKEDSKRESRGCNHVESHACSRDPLRPWIESMEDYFRALPPPHPTERLRAIEEQQNHKTKQHHRLSFCNGVEVERNMDYGHQQVAHKAAGAEDEGHFSWDGFLLFSHACPNSERQRAVSDGTGGCSSRRARDKKHSDDLDDGQTLSSAARKKKHRDGMNDRRTSWPSKAGRNAKHNDNIDGRHTGWSSSATCNRKHSDPQDDRASGWSSSSATGNKQHCDDMDDRHTSWSFSGAAFHKKQGDDFDERHAAIERTRRSCAHTKHSDIMGDGKEKSSASATGIGKYDDDCRIRDSFNPGETPSAPPSLPPRRRQQRHRSCACNAFDVFLAD